MKKRGGLLKVLSVMMLGVLLLAALAPVALAADSRGGDNVVIGPDEVVNEDLYVGAQTFVLNGTVKGDLVVVGSSITINGTVEGDLIAAGQSVVVNGKVLDDARIAGAALELGEGAVIGDHVMSAGYSLHNMAGSQVAGDLTFVGGQALLAGDVGGDVQVGAEGLDLQGQVAGNVEASLGSPEDDAPFPPTSFMPNMPATPVVRGGLTLGSSAQVGGKLEYTSRQSVDVPAGVVMGEVMHRIPEVTTDVKSGDKAGRDMGGAAVFGTLAWIFKQVRRFVALLLMGLLVVLVLPKFTEKLSDKLAEKPLPSLGWGALALVAFFAAMLLIVVVTFLLALFFGMVSLGGLVGTIVSTGVMAGGLLSYGFGLVTTYLAQIVVAFLLGSLILKGANLTPVARRLLALLIGLVLFALVRAVPFLGGLVNFVVVLFVLGALWLLLQEKLRKPAV